MSLSTTYSDSQRRIKANTARYNPARFITARDKDVEGVSHRGPGQKDKNIEIGTSRAPTQKDKNIEIGTSRAQFYETRPKLTDYDKAVLELQSDLKNKGYKLSDKQLDTLMGTGAKVPNRKEELTLTLGSRSARRVSPYSSTSSSSLKLGY